MMIEHDRMGRRGVVGLALAIVTGTMVGCAAMEGQKPSGAASSAGATASAPAGGPASSPVSAPASAQKPATDPSRGIQIGAAPPAPTTAAPPAPAKPAPATSTVTPGPVSAAPPVPAPAAAAAAPPAAAPVAPAPAAAALKPAAPPTVMPYDEAVLFAANNLFSKAELPPAPLGTAAKFPLVIDPLVDGYSGYQSVATRNMEARIAGLVKERFPTYDLQPFSTSTLARGPLLFIGTFTPLDKDNKNVGPRERYRICLALVDLRTGRIVSKGLAFARPDGVDPTPLPFFQDSPAWSGDPAVEGYVRTCQGTKVGDPINPVYWDRIVAAALVNDAMTAYNEKRYDEALDLYKGVQRTGAGDQLRVYNGIYLSSWKLGRKDEAAQAFGQIVDFGLKQNKLGVKFLFRPGSTLFWADPQVSAPYPVWLKQISQRSAQQDKCMEVSGHTSRTGPEPLNERLSLARAQYVKQRLEAGSPQLGKRVTTVGKGSSQNISGLGTDDARDAVDRRVEFRVVDCKV
jgi:outer membrane protein OmpA-like peptidoglycan-associated protein